MLQILFFLTFLEYAFSMCTTPLLTEMVGGPIRVDPNSQSVIKAAEFAAQQYSGLINANFALNNVISGTSQIVAGVIFDLNVVLKDNNCINGQKCNYQKCNFKVLNQNWMRVQNTLLSHNCGSIYMV